MHHAVPRRTRMSLRCCKTRLPPFKGRGGLVCLFFLFPFNRKVDFPRHWLLVWCLLAAPSGHHYHADGQRWTNKQTKQNALVKVLAHQCDNLPFVPCNQQNNKIRLKFRVTWFRFLTHSVYCSLLLFFSLFHWQSSPGAWSLQFLVTFPMSTVALD